jgi:hypothetical protein
VIKKEAGKILKFKDLIIQIQCMWNVKAKGATGTISESLRQYLSNIPGRHEFMELQTTAILGAAHINLGKYDSLQKRNTLGTLHIKRKVLQSETCEVWGVGIAAVSREVPGRKVCDKRHNNNNNNNNKHKKATILATSHIKWKVLQCACGS